MRILITGAAGRIGRRLIAELLPHGHALSGCDQVEAPGLEIPYTAADIRDLAAMERACAGHEAVVHLAAIPGPGSRDTRTNWPDIVHRNILGTYNVLEAAVRQGVRRVVFASSLCAEGWLPGEHFQRPRYFPLDEEHPLQTEEPYGMSKQIGEIYGWGFHKRCGLEFISLRPMNVQDAEANGPGVLYSAQPTWQRVDRGDVARAFRLALESPISWGVYQVCSRYRYRADGSRQPLDEVMAAIHATGATEIKDLPWFLEGGGTFSCRKAMHELGYDPRY
jgi:nucleoside-diphosphate-sugar epimerase